MPTARHILLVFLVFARSMLANNVSDELLLDFSNLSVEHGLPHSTVSSFYQDSRGFLWIGTGNGVARYDGKHFEVFRNNAFDRNSLSGITVMNILGFRYAFGECLWIVTSNEGLSLFNLDTRVFTQFRNREGEIPVLSSNKVQDVFVAPGGYLWVATEVGLDFIDPFTGRVYIDPLGLSKASTRVIEHNQQLLVGTRQGLHVFALPRLVNGEFVFTVDQARHGFPHLSISFLFARDNTLWIGANDGLFQCDLSSWNLVRKPVAVPPGMELVNYSFRNYFYDEEASFLWLSIYGIGIVRYNMVTGESSFLRSNTGPLPK